MPGAVLHDRGGSLPIIDCQIAFPSARGQPVGTPILKVKALVDTGATNVVAPPHLIAALSLPETGTQTHTIVGGTERCCSTFQGDIILTGMQYENNSIPFISTVRNACILSDHLSGFDIILGWDVLHSFDMTFHRRGTLLIHLPD